MEKAKQINVLLVGVSIIVSQILIECHAQISYEIKNWNCTFDETYFNKSNSECTLKAVNGRNKFLSVYAEQIKPINDIKVDINVYSLADGHFHFLFNISENLCHIAEEMKTSDILLAVRPLWQQYTNIPLECPVEAGKYYVRDMDYNDLAGKFIPAVLPNGHYKIDIKGFNKNDNVSNGSIVLLITKKSK